MLDGGHISLQVAALMRKLSILRRSVVATGVWLVHATARPCGVRAAAWCEKFLLCRGCSSTTNRHERLRRLQAAQFCLFGVFASRKKQKKTKNRHKI